jgi:hypothetical protein
MCNICNQYTQFGRCGYNTGCGLNPQNICRDSCGNIWVRVATGATQTDVCQCTCTYRCGGFTPTANTGNNTAGSFCVDGDAYYARQYGLNGNTRSCGCGCHS